MDSTVGGLVRVLSETDRNDDIPRVWDAYRLAERAHRGQRRVNGDRYIRHPIEVATIVAGHGGSADAVCAALLHDVVEDAAVTRAHLRREAGPGVAMIVEAITDRAIRGPVPASREVMLVAVADRLHNLRTLRGVPAASRQRASLDSLVVHVPMARVLAVPAIAAELTDLACGSLDSMERPNAVTRRGRIAAQARRADPRWAAEAVAAVGGAAVAGSGAVPEWALASGGAGLLALVTAALFSHDPRASRRLAELVAAWRRR